ncbi:polysaccharide deacetylase family protein [Blastomonas fulva]|jgi:hypothetical protein|uniref:polysaccharide deacetylase family protein n=1 Tax=Blastomonas fulva TaxID=1550728 RepID=UPI003D26E493
MSMSFGSNRIRAVLASLAFTICGLNSAEASDKPVAELPSASRNAALDAPLSAAGFEVAVTVDDLPLQGEPIQGSSRLSIARAFLAELKSRRVPEVMGFINAGAPADLGETDAVLRAWRRAGYPLGNHTLTHLSLSDARSFDDWKANVEGNEQYLIRYMGSKGWRYMRLPNLTTGRSKERHDSAVDYLDARRYRLAEVSVSFGDWAYVEAYKRCTMQRDEAGIAALEATYFDQVDRGLLRMKLLSQLLYSRQIRQVLVMHLSAWSVRTLPGVLSRIEAAGGRYITLARALDDPAYREPAAERGKGLLLERVATRRNMPLPGQVLNRPDLAVAGVCRNSSRAGNIP